jgi:hypothetical protein
MSQMWWHHKVQEQGRRASKLLTLNGQFAAVVASYDHGGPTSCRNIGNTAVLKPLLSVLFRHVAGLRQRNS